MSWQATRWAKRTRGHGSRGGQKLVLMVLAEYHDVEKDCAWPSQQMLAKDCELDERSVRRHLGQLVANGYIEVLNKGNQHRSTTYKLCMTKSEPGTAGVSEPDAADRCSEPDNPCTGQHVHVNRTAEVSEPDTPRMTSNQEDTEEPINKYLVVFNALSEIPGYVADAHSDALLNRWLGRHGLDPGQVEETVWRMKSTVAYEQPKQRWKYLNSQGKTSYYIDLRAVLRNWVKRSNNPPWTGGSVGKSGNNHAQDSYELADAKRAILLQRLANSTGRPTAGGEFQPQVPSV